MKAWEYHIKYLWRFCDWVHDTDYSFVIELINLHLSEYSFIYPYC